MRFEIREWLLGTRVAPHQNEYYMEISRLYRNISEED